MQKYLFKNIQLINDEKIATKDILVRGERIEKIEDSINLKENAIEINGEGKYLMPGVIDDQVHFREPGLTHKADIFTESRAAVAGGTTSFMEMPNTVPNALTIGLLEDKYNIAATKSLANYSFFMGVGNDNAEEVLRTNKMKEKICGVKIFMGSSTGNMLVDNYITLNKIFADSELLIATHCEDEKIIQRNYKEQKFLKGDLTADDHPIIRDEEACFESSFAAVQLAKQHDSRLHILHISTQKELQLFGNMLPLKEKRITAEVCVHHLHFTADDYAQLGYKIKCNPAIKAAHNKEALWQALLDDRLDVVATDHAPHLPAEKQAPYEQAHSGLPLVQHSLLLMLHYHSLGKISLEKIVKKMCHNVADCFLIKDRGFVQEGFFADLVVLDQKKHTSISAKGSLYKCGWTPLENLQIPFSVHTTMVNGNIVYGNGAIIESNLGQRLSFNR